MNNNNVYIHAASAIDPLLNSEASTRTVLTGIPDKADATAQVKKLVGDPLRQASHLVKMGVIGVMQCRKQIASQLDDNTAIYVGTGLGEMDKCRGLFAQVMPPVSGMASPFDFISSSSNISAFYAAKILGLSTRNLTISQDEFSFEYALTLAMDDIRANACNQAFVGGLDERSVVIDYQLRRMKINDDQILGEGCGWLYLKMEADGALACIEDVTFFHASNKNEEHWADDVADKLGRIDGNIIFLPGFRINDAAC
ncbi:MAG: hypothetical protein IME93_02070, partial [Proteobacteria bacterium]|nr:hypothetical protein [Pseudomonadota bacterium]